MRVMMTTDAVGGVWQYTAELIAALAPLGVEVVVAVLGPVEAVRLSELGGAAAVINTALPLDWLSSGDAQVRASARALASLAREHRVDLVHLNSPTLALSAWTVPVVAVAHGCVGTWWRAAHGTAPAADYAWHGEMMRDGLLAADATVAPSASFAAVLQQHYQLPFAPVVVHNGRTMPGGKVAGEPAPYAFTAGRLWDRVKNTALLDQVAARLPVPLRAAGPLIGPHGEAVAVDHLEAAGVLDAAALATALSQRPVFVSAASFEPFGLAVLEAAAAGCALVLSGIDTFRELWTGAALIVPEQDDAAYAAAIERVIAEPALRTHLGEAARMRARRFSPAATATAMIDVYQDAVARFAGAGRVAA